MFGVSDNVALRGIIPRAASHLFEGINNAEDVEEVVRFGPLRQTACAISAQPHLMFLDCCAVRACAPVQTIKCSFLEVYREVIRDLLVPGQSNLKIRELPGGEVTVQDLSGEYVGSQDDILELIANGEKNRSVSRTDVSTSSQMPCCHLKLRCVALTVVVAVVCVRPRR